MPKIYELFGYPITDNSPEICESRRRAFCPFISDICDGGGNRHMSDIHLKEHRELQEFFPGMDYVPSGVCSIQISDGSSPWIICPRRLLYMGKKANDTVLHGEAQSRLLEKCPFSKGLDLGIWEEVKVKYSNENGDDYSAFDYTFDYVLMPIGRISKEDAIKNTELGWAKLEKALRDGGFTFSIINGKSYIEDFPVGEPIIVEVMTSSTSGGNKKKRSCIPQAFEDCILGKPHMAPGINYRQVWARMASQLIVKSQAAIAWNGIAIWVLQDLLVDYVSSSTALDLHKFISDHVEEVNILAFSYGNHYKLPASLKTVSLNNTTLYSGPICASDEDKARPCFQDIILAPVCPPKSVLIASLCKKGMANRIKV